MTCCYRNVKGWLDELKENIYSAKVEQLPYKSADVKHWLVSLRRNDEDVKEFEQFLAEMSGCKVENNHVYKVTFSDGEIFGISIYDLQMIIGIGVVQSKW